MNNAPTNMFTRGFQQNFMQFAKKKLFPNQKVIGMKESVKFMSSSNYLSDFNTSHSLHLSVWTGSCTSFGVSSSVTSNYHPRSFDNRR